MTENINEKDIENDELICPITLELFRDPVRAKDGHVYERQAITKWILEHGTSPLTRQPLQIEDLQTDEHLKNLARQRRNSTVSYNSQNQQIILPPLRRFPRNSHQIFPTEFSNSMRINYSSHKYCCAKILIVFLALAVPISVIIAIYLFIQNLQNGITSIYSGTLTTNSPQFIRSTSPSVIQSYYNAIQINIVQDGTYTFKSQSKINLYGYLYQNYFNTSVSLNLLISDNDSGGNNQFYFQYFLSSYINYVLVVTTFNNNTVGSYSVYVTGPSTVIFNPI